MRYRRMLAAAVGCLTGALGVCGSSLAALHTYVVSEVFSSVDGKVQFVELREAFGAPSQNIFSAGALVARNEDGSQSRTFNFGANLVSTNTANTRVLIATAAFSALPGAPTPDYIMPDGFLFMGSGSIQFTGNFDGEVPYTGLPTDGVTSLTLPAGTPAANSPRNFNMGGATGQSGTVSVPPGACCSGAACEQRIQTNCTGIWTAGQLCDAGACAPATGLCCRAATCAITEPGACASLPGGIGAAFTAGASSCNAPGALAAPCCFADIDKTGGIQIDDLFLYLNLWFGNSAYAEVGGNGAGAPSIDDLFLYLSAYFQGGC